MKIHSSTLTANDLWQAASLIEDCEAEITTHGSRSHARSFTLKLSGYGPGMARRRGNSGQYGAMSEGDGYALMWDEWGIVLAELYRRDPDMVCGSVKRPTYANAEDYHWQTGERFEASDITLHTHRWEYLGDFAGYNVYSCKGTKTLACPARRRWETHSHRIQSLNGTAS